MSTASETENEAGTSVEETTVAEAVSEGPTRAEILAANHVPKVDKKTGEFLGTGRRKSSVARVRLKPGNGQILINDRPLEEFFCLLQHRNAVLAPLEKVEQVGAVDVKVRVHGGGITGQAGACMLGIARALREMNIAFDEPLREGHYLTRDSRMVERKKYGLHGARRGTQFSKR